MRLPGDSLSPPLATDPRRRTCPGCQGLLYPDQLCDCSGEPSEESPASSDEPADE